MTLSGDHPAENPPSAFERLTAAVTTDSLTPAQRAVILALLQELDRWSRLATQAEAERPADMSDRAWRSGYLLGLADRLLELYRWQLGGLAQAAAESSDGPKAY